MAKGEEEGDWRINVLSGLCIRDDVLEERDKKDPCSRHRLWEVVLEDVVIWGNCYYFGRRMVSARRQGLRLLQ